ncbi:MAG TPA: ferritin-like domain-containing protein [Sporichthya sp.]|nr:ferritin-like domain-containing protein [Sporichthya sp.]
MTNKLIAQLRTLLQLTYTEASIAETRVAQARSEAVRRELRQNARNAEQRAEALQNALRDLGGVPDVVGPALGRLGAIVKTPLEQTFPLDEALLQDLALEHQLLDRARYVKALAETAEDASVQQLAERLITAHTATVEWLTVVLAEEALGGPATLQATPLQRVAGGATRVMNTPARIAVEGVNRAAANATQVREQAKTTLSQAKDKASTLTNAAREVLATGRNASLRQAEHEAKQAGDLDTARSVHRVRRETGALDATELPIKNYDELYAQDAVKAVKALDKAADVRAVMRYEENNAARRSVISAAEAQITELAKEAAGVS